MMCRVASYGLGLVFLLSTQAATAANVNSTAFECVIEPQQTVKLATPVVGVIARLDVDRGDIVRRGQVLGKLEDGPEAATVELANVRAKNEHTVGSIEARLKFLRSKVRRLSELQSRAVGSQAAL